MKYEIQRRSTCEPEIWFTVAEAGLKIWAEKIARALRANEKGEYRVWEDKRARKIMPDIGNKYKP